MKNSMKVEDESKKEKVESHESGADSLLLHCVIETIASVNDLKASTCQHYNAKSDAENWWECECKNIEMSDCVAIPEDIVMNDLIKTVLLKLGYPSCASSFAAGSLLIRNWKPLSLDTICPSLKKTVGDILGELTPVITLRIQIFWPKITTLQIIKDNLLSFLIKTNQNFLRESGCPLDTCTLFKVCDQSNCLRKQEPSDEVQRKFDGWLRHLQETEKEVANEKTKVQSNYLPNNTKNIIKTNTNRVSGGGGVYSPSQSLELTRSEPAGKSFKEAEDGENANYVKESSSCGMEKPKHFAAPKTRIRTSFDPEFELPKLHKWYMENPHPSRQQIYEYVVELNSLDSRKGRKQLDVNNVVYWFKNARAAQKRTECRRFSNVITPGANRGNVIKIPLRKSSGVISDDQKSVSDDEGSVTSESGDDYSNGNGRRLQVLGKWNSNGQGEAVLEMQIESHKNEFNQSNTVTKTEQVSENEETSKSALLSTDEDSVEPGRRTSPHENKNGMQKENQTTHFSENNNRDVRNDDKHESEQIQRAAEAKEDEVSSLKVQSRNSFIPYKENNGVNSSSFLTPYKSGFPVPPNSIIGHSFICMSQYMNPKPSNLPLSSEERRKRNRTFIDPVTEVPCLEQWFRLSTHPSHSLIARYTEELNNMPYRRKFPKLETKNVQFWFKNRRAKNKRLNYLEANN